MSSQGGRGLLTLASVVVVVAGLKAASAFLVPFLLAVFLTLLSLPLHAWLRARVPRWVAVGVTVLANVALVVGLVALVSGSVTDFVAAAPRYRVRLEGLGEALLGWFEAHGVPTADWVSAENIGLGSVLDLVGSTLRGLASVVTHLLLVVVTMFFLLLEIERLPSKLCRAFGLSPSELGAYGHASETVQKYLLVKTATSAATGVSIGVGSSIIGLDFPVLWGLVAFLFNYVPNLGSIIAAIPAVLLAVVQLGPGGAIAVLVLFVTVNVVFGNVLEPQLLGRRLGLSPLVIFVSLIFWGWVWGPVGMLISVPLTVVIRIFFEESRQFGWVSVLLAARAPDMPSEGDDPEARTESSPEAGTVELTTSQG